MSDLTDFLLARIAEDEDTARDWRADRNALAGAEDWDDDWRYGPTRDLAECEAKRRIVRESAAWDSGHGGGWAFRFAMKALALPYADHPDYREEWKP